MTNSEITAFMQSGAAHYRAKEYDAAIADFTKAIEGNQNSASAYYGRGIVYAAKGDMDWAVAEWEAALRIEPGHAKARSSLLAAYNKRGNAYAQKREFDLAAGEFNLAIRLDPQNAAAWYGRGIVHYNRGNRKEALADLAAAARLAPDNGRYQEVLKKAQGAPREKPMPTMPAAPAAPAAPTRGGAGLMQSARAQKAAGSNGDEAGREKIMPFDAENPGKGFKCGRCGAPLPIPKNSRGRVRCPSCKAESVIEGLVKNAEMADKENINSGYPLSATAAMLHKNLLACISQSPSIPLDIFEKAEVVREEHYCVPAYLFYCNGTASYTYEAGNVRQHKTAIDLGDKTRVEKENYMEWTQMNGTVNASATAFASGNRTAVSQIKELYMFLDPNELVDYDELEFPPDVVTYDYNLPQAAAFNEHIKPYVEELLKEKTLKALQGKEYRNLSMGGGSRIDKDEIVRVFLGLYRIVLIYGGKEYTMWAIGDGKKIINSGMPVDLERQKILEEKQQAKKRAIENITAPKTGLFTFLGIVCIPLALVTFGVSLIGTIVFFILRSQKRKTFGTKRAEVEAQFQREIDSFTAQAQEVLEQFKRQKKGMRGIYRAEVTGDSSAF